MQEVTLEDLQSCLREACQLTDSQDEGMISHGMMSAGLSDSEGGKKREKAEASIQKKFHKQLFTPFAKACKTYRLIREGDRIAVCISGGKDSMLMAKLSFVESNIFKSVENVSLDTVIAYKKDGVRHHFLDEYETKVAETESDEGV